MAKIKNSQTGDVLDVKNLGHDENGVFVYTKSSRLGEKWLAKFPMISCTGEAIQSSAKTWKVYINIADGWSIDSSRKPRTPKVRQPEPEQPKETEVPEIPQPEQPQPQPEPEQPQPTPQLVQPAPTFNVTGLEGGLAQVFAPVFQQVASQIEASIRAKVDAEMRELKDVAEKKARRIEVVIDGKVNKVTGKTHKEFNRVLQRVARGRHIYLWGPAGTGKSYLAKQIAEALGVPFYSETTLQDPFDLKGFVDATGRYQETQFYRAVKNGGVFNLDEGDASAADIFVVVNTLLANGYFSFPNGERLDCHPDFHFMCTANTCGLGATQEYNGRFKMDESTRDRFSFIYIAPDPEIEMQTAGNDTEIIEFVYAVRDAVKRAIGLEFNASSRVIKALAMSAEYDETPEETLDAEFVKGRNIDAVKSLVSNMYLTSSNKWMKALINISKDEQWKR